jgi:hypothetical protein
MLQIGVVAVAASIFYGGVRCAPFTMDSAALGLVALSYTAGGAYFTMDSAAVGLAASGCSCCTARIFRQKRTHKERRCVSRPCSA